MPTVTLNKAVFEKLVGKKLELEQLKDRISMLGTDLEKIEGNEIVVEVFPNRPDMLSEQGFARALSSFIGVKTGLRKYDVKKGGKDYRVIIEEPVKKVRPFTACAIVKNLKFDDEKIREVIQLQEKLHVTLGRNRKKLAIGIYPLEEIKLPITYTAKKPKDIKFRPLESAKEMTGDEILENHPTGREYAHLLEGKGLFPVFIDANGEVLSVPPIINSHKTGKITEKTKEVFIECSGFDMNALSQCLNIIVTSLADMGGELYEMQLEHEKERNGKDNAEKIITPNLKPIEWDLDLKYVKKMLGLELSESDIKKLLEKMGCGYQNKKVLVPAYRVDILHQIDLAEDIAIAYGYENFEPEIPNVSTIGEENHVELFKSRIANILVGLGLIETSSYDLTNREINNAKMELEHNNEVVELANALNKDYSSLRSWILPNLMQILSENTNREYPQNIFEIGNAFEIDKSTETGVKESYKLAVVLCDVEIDFTRIKQILDSLMNALGTDYEIKNSSHASFIPGRTATVLVNKKEVAVMGELAPSVLSNFGIVVPVTALELDLDELAQLFEAIRKK
jgi:phenylalanyl-tRNA synthetase beta chain